MITQGEALLARTFKGVKKIKKEKKTTERCGQSIQYNVKK